MRPFAVVLLVSAGCLSADTAPTTVHRPPVPPTVGVVLTTGLIELPPGDPYLTSGLWKDATDPLPHRLSGVLLRNGLRVGVVGGLRPARLDELLGSESTFRHVTHRTLPAETTKVIPVNGPVEQCRFGHFADLHGPAAYVDLTAAEFGVSVSGEATAGGVRLRLEPVAQHGTKELALSVSGDGLTRADRRPRERFPALGFEVTLAAGEHLVIGATDATDTVGGAWFVDATDSRVRQRVLVIRADR